MIIENRRRVKQVEETVSIVHLSKEDIKDLVINYISSDHGIKNVPRDNISFNTSYKYVSDEWGMNRSIVATFDGVTVELPEEVE